MTLTPTPGAVGREGVDHRDEPVDDAPPVDDRFRDRREAVARGRRERRRRVFLLVALVVVLVGAAVIAVRSPLLDVDRVRVRGAGEARVRGVVAASGLERDDPMLWVDERAVEQRIEALPWVASASVTRDWPGTVRIAVTTRRPVAYAEVGGRVAVLDGSSQVLSVGDVGDVATGSGAGELLEIRGVRVLPEPGETLYPVEAAGLRDALPPALAPAVVAVDLAGTADVRLITTTGPELRFGDLGDAEAKGAAAAAVLERLAAEGATYEYVDVRVPEAPVAGTADGTVVPALTEPVDP
jgi:cell division protein FtsQ